MGEVNIISSTVAVISPCNLGPGDLSCLRRHKLRAEGRALLLPPVSDSEPGELRVLTHGRGGFAHRKRRFSWWHYSPVIYRRALPWGRHHEFVPLILWAEGWGGGK